MGRLLIPRRFDGGPLGGGSGSRDLEHDLTSSRDTSEQRARGVSRLSLSCSDLLATVWFRLRGLLLHNLPVIFNHLSSVVFSSPPIDLAPTAMHLLLVKVTQHLLSWLLSSSPALNQLFGYLSRQCPLPTAETSGAPYLIHSLIRAAMAPLCKLLAVSAAFTSVLALNRVDTHFHALPPPYVEALNAAGGDPSGFPTPEWTLDAAIESMNQVNSDIG